MKCGSTDADMRSADLVSNPNLPGLHGNDMHYDVRVTEGLYSADLLEAASNAQWCAAAASSLAICSR